MRIQIDKEKQNLARYEKLLSMEKLRKRKADTRRKIELGGLVIKSGMGKFNKAIILGALDYAFTLIAEKNSYKDLFESAGETLFL